MRKEYIKPEVLIEELELVSMVAASVGVGEAVEYSTTDAQGRRGGWGDLWGGKE